MAFELPISLLSSTTATGAGSGSSLDLGGVYTTAKLLLAVSAASGTTKSLVVTLETSEDGATWSTVGSFSTVTTAGQVVGIFPGCGRYIRASWTVTGTGTPSFTFSLAGVKRLVYATPTDLAANGLPDGWLADVSVADQEAALEAETGHFDGYFAGRWLLPLSAWGDDVRAKCAEGSAYRIMRRLGLDPDKPANALLVKSRDDVDAWLRRVSQREITPQGIVDASPLVEEGSVYVISDPPLGW